MLTSSLFNLQKLGSANVSSQNQSGKNQPLLSSNTDEKLGSFGVHKIFERYFQEEISGLSPLTAKAKQYDLEKFLTFYQGTNGHLNLKEWLPRDTKLFIDELQKQNYAASTCNRALATVRAFGRWLRDEDIINHDPCRKIKDLQLPAFEPKRIDDQDYHRILKTSDVLSMTKRHEAAQDFRNKAMIILLNNSGLRIHEILSLRLWQLQEKGKKLVQIKCKGSKVRDVRISKECVEILFEYISSYRISQTDFLFVNRYGQNLSRNGIAKALNKIASVASVSLPEKIKVTPHRFRHRHGYNARKLKGDVFAASRLGHSTLNYVGRYATLSSEEETDLVEKL